MATLTLTIPSTLTSLGGALPSVGLQAAPPIILADYIDTETQDFKSMLSTLDQIDAQVVIAITTRRGSGAAVMEVGNNLHDLKKITSSIQTDIKAQIQKATKLLVSNGDITLKPIEFTNVAPGDQQVEFVVKWYNKRSGVLASVRALLETV